MKPAEWPDEGTVLSFARVEVVPVGLTQPFNLTLVAVAEKGPKVICWATGVLKVGDEVTITDDNGKYICNPKLDKNAD